MITPSRWLLLFLASSSSLLAQSPAANLAAGQAATRGIILNRPEVSAVDQAQVRELVARNLEVRGGRAALSAVPALRIEGTITERFRTTKLVRETRPDGALREESQREANGWTMRQVTGYFNGTAWSQEFTPSPRDPKILGAEETRRLLLLADPMSLLAEEGVYFEAAGSATFAGRRCLKVAARHPDGRDLTYFIDPGSAHVLNIRLQDIRNGFPVEADCVPLGLRKVAGVWMVTGYDFRVEGESYRRVDYPRIDVAKARPDVAYQLPKPPPPPTPVLPEDSGAKADSKKPEAGAGPRR